MKKVSIVVLFAVMAICAMTCNAGTITWVYGGDMTSQGFVAGDAGWLVSLYQDVSQNGFGAGGTFGGDDVAVAGDTTIITSGKAGIAYGSSFTAPAGSLTLGADVYTVVWNAATQGLATQYRIVDAAPYALPAADQNATYQLNAISNGWQPVPEPGTMALLGLGLVTLATRSIRKKQ